MTHDHAPDDVPEKVADAKERLKDLGLDHRLVTKTHRIVQHREDAPSQHIPVVRSRMMVRDSLRDLEEDGWIALEDPDQKGTRPVFYETLVDEGTESIHLTSLVVRHENDDTQERLRRLVEEDIVDREDVVDVVAIMEDVVEVLS